MRSITRSRLHCMLCIISSLPGRNLESLRRTHASRINAATQRGKVPHLAPPNKQAISKLKQFSLKTYLFFARYTFSFGHHRRRARAALCISLSACLHICNACAHSFSGSHQTITTNYAALRPKWAKFAHLAIEPRREKPKFGAARLQECF